VVDEAEHGETLYPKLKVPTGVFDRLRQSKAKRDPIEDVEQELSRLQKETTTFRLYNPSEVIPKDT